MKSNPPSTSSIPSPTLTYATACTVPRSFSSLSSSFTPFYPRSQQQHYHSQPGSADGYDGGCYGSPQKPDDSAAYNYRAYVQPHIDGPNVYNHLNYASLGSEPYEVSWPPESFYGVNMWGCLDAWQWGDPALVEYANADGEAEHSAYLFHRAGSPPIEEESYTSSPSNTASLPAPFHGQGVTVASSVFQSSAPLEQGGRCWLNNKNLITAVGGSPVASFKKMTPESLAILVDDSEKKGLAEGIRNEVANGFASGKMDGRSTLDKQSSQMCSSVDVEPTMEQITIKTLKEHHFETDNSTKLDSPTVCLEPLPAEIVQEDVGSINSLAVQNSHTSVTSTSCCTHSQYAIAQASLSSLGKTCPVEPENCCGSPPGIVKAPLDLGTEGRPCDEATDVESLHYDKIGFSNGLPSEVGLCSDGSQLLIKTIYNLSKVLLTSQSGDSSSGFHLMGAAIENSICMLSQCLLQRLYVNEAGICHDQQSCQGQLQFTHQDLKRSDVATVVDDEAGIPNVLEKCLRPLVSTWPESTFSPAETGPCRKSLEREGLENFSKVSVKSCVEDDESSSVKKHLEKPLKELSELKHELMKLQEEIVYERIESKNLWTEAREAVDLFRLEIMKMRAELEGLKQASRKLKHAGLKGEAVGLDFTGHDIDSSCINHEGLYENFPEIVADSSQNFVAQITCRKPDSEGNSGFCGSSGEGLPKINEVLTGYFEPMRIVQVDCTEKNWGASLLENENVISRHSLQATTNQNGDKFGIAASKPLPKCRVEPPTDLENGVAHRLSLLLARQGLNLNVTCTDSVSANESSSDANNLFALPSNVPRESETMQPGIKLSSIYQQEVPFQSEIRYTAGANKQVGYERTGSNCLMKSDLDPKDVRADILRMSHGQVEDGHHGRAAEIEKSKTIWNASQEDEIEIICLRPNDADNNLVCLKGEPEWEHVVVTRGLCN